MSVNESNSNWALSTAGGIKYKLVDGYPTGSFTDESGQIVEKYIVRAGDVNAFLNESFPPVLIVGPLWYFQSKRACPQFRGLFTKTVDFGPFRSGKPGDPFNAYGGLTDTETYSAEYLVTITYTADKDQGSEDNNNESFLTVTADTGGEWLVIDAAENSVWNGGAGDDEPIDDFQLPGTQLVPKTQWNVKWPKFPNTLLSDVVERAREAFGKVNSDPMSLFQDAVKETILFTGFSYTEEWSWKETGPAVSMNMTFDEKFIKDGDVNDADVTHQHIYRPGKGFQKLLIDGKNLYKTSDLNELFV